MKMTRRDICRICCRVLKAVAAVVAVIVAFVVLVVVLELPGIRRFHRYCGYPCKDALLVAESANVVDCVECTVNGENVTIVSMGFIGLLPSGAAMIVYDADGKRIDQTSDEGDDGCFQRKWSHAWNEALRTRKKGGK